MPDMHFQDVQVCNFKQCKHFLSYLFLENVTLSSVYMSNARFFLEKAFWKNLGQEKKILGNVHQILGKGIQRLEAGND